MASSAGYSKVQTNELSGGQFPPLNALTKDQALQEPTGGARMKKKTARIGCSSWGGRSWGGESWKVNEREYVQRFLVRDVRSFSDWRKKGLGMGTQRGTKEEEPNDCVWVSAAFE